MAARKNVPNPSAMLTEATCPETKSWVASRFNLIEEAGSSRRRCKFLNCGKEYSRGTSHMILKRHWSKQHADQYSGPKRSNRNTTNSSSDNTIDIDATDRPALNKPPTTNLNSPTKKRPLKTNNNIGSKNKAGSQQNLVAENATNNINTSSNINNNNKNQSTNQKTGQAVDVKLVAKRLKEAASIHLTFDIYTPKKGGKSYGIITAHSISDDRVVDIKSVLLEYKFLPYPDDSTALYEFLRTCITRFNIKEKIVSIVSNCSPILVNSIQEVDKRYRLSKNYNFTTVHIQCFPQFVHSNVLEVLRCQEGHIDCLRKVVSLINTNNITLRTFQQQENATSNNPQGGDTVVENNANPLGGSLNPTGTQIDSEGTVRTPLKLPMDNKSSWNTTYNMIDAFVQQRDFIEPALMCLQDPQELTNVSIDWNRHYTLIQLLKPFYDVIEKFSTDNYAPVSLIAVTIPHLMDHLANTSWAYEELVMVVHNFKLQLETYRQEFQSDLTVIASFLDPRVKDTFVAPEARDGAIAMLRKRVENQNAHVKAEVQQLQQHHQRQQAIDNLWSRVFRSSPKYDEVSDYLSSPREHCSTAVVAYWEAQKFVYPSLYLLAKTLACVQATSVPNERMFSAAENEREKKMQVECTNSKELQKSWAKYLEK